MRRYITIVSILLSFFASVKAQESKNEIDFLAEEKRNTNTENTYKFSVTYRVQGGFVQQWQHSNNKTYADLYLYGPKIGVTFDFNLPYNFSIQTGLNYSLTYGISNQHWKNASTDDYSEQYLKHRIMNHELSIPVRATIRIHLWKELGLMFYTGPEISVGLAQKDNIKNYLNYDTEKWLQSIYIKTEPYDRYAEKELFRTNIQYGLGGGLEWANYRLQAGYDFGLNNLIKQQTEISRQMHSWSWNIIFSYSIP
ncbi:MAG: outer membrane beta-barrel protein [Paludibacteraceae bacterium]|nr:outer membrane beta-barrel protein [Paludibacteraceae bacterium]